MHKSWPKNCIHTEEEYSSNSEANDDKDDGAKVDGGHGSEIDDRELTDREEQREVRECLRRPSIRHHPQSKKTMCYKD